MRSIQQDTEDKKDTLLKIQEVCAILKGEINDFQLKWNVVTQRTMQRTALSSYGDNLIRLSHKRFITSLNKVHNENVHKKFDKLFDELSFYVGKMMFLDQCYDLAISCFDKLDSNIYACVNWYQAQILVKTNCLDFSKIKKKFEKAISIRPTVVVYYLEYATWCIEMGWEHGSKPKYWTEAENQLQAAMKEQASILCGGNDARLMYDHFMIETEYYWTCATEYYCSPSPPEHYPGCGYSIRTGYE